MDRISSAGSAPLRQPPPMPAPKMEADSTPGSLIIADRFMAMLGEYAHGFSASEAAMRGGYHGQLVMRNPSNQFPAEATRAQETLMTPNRSAEETLRALTTNAVGQQAHMLKTSTEELNAATQRGVRNSAMNLSHGMSPADLVAQYYGQAALAWNPKASPEERQMGQVQMENLARAFKVDPKALSSSDPAVNGPARQALQQGLIDHIGKTSGDPAVKAGQQAYAKAVNNFEARHNSVVVAGGNNGYVVGDLQSDNGGRALKIPPGFHDNVLANSETTNVGATMAGPPGSGQIRAPYSSPSSRVNMYANGDLPATEQRGFTQGTSFAAPRVAGLMAEIHRRNPHLSSSQVQNLVAQQMSHSSPGGQPTVDEQRAIQYMFSGGTK